MSLERQARRDEWWISLNVTRTRITLLGFNLSFVAFIIGFLLTDGGYLELGLEHGDQRAFGRHMPAMSALFVAFAASILSIACLLASQELDSEGLSRPWVFTVGDILMYLAFSQSVAGFTRKYLGGVNDAIEWIYTNHSVLHEVGAFLNWGLASLGILAWALLIYVGPVLAIVKSPVSPRGRKLLYVAYGVMVLAVFYVAVQAHILQDAVLGHYEPPWQIFLWQFVQPLTW